MPWQNVWCKLSPFEMLYACLPKLPVEVRDVLLVNTVNVAIPLRQCHIIFDVKRIQHQQIAMTLERRMHAHVMGRLKHLNRKRPQPDLQMGDLVMELPPISGPLQTNFRGPLLVVEVNVQKNIFVLQIGGTANNRSASSSVIHPTSSISQKGRMLRSSCYWLQRLGGGGGKLPV